MKTIFVVMVVLFANCLTAQESIPAGTILPVRLNSTINSRRMHADQETAIGSSIAIAMKHPSAKPISYALSRYISMHANISELRCWQSVHVTFSSIGIGGQPPDTHRSFAAICALGAAGGSGEGRRKSDATQQRGVGVRPDREKP